ncbi:MAG: imidazole glycerol phosphate synthase subunit HisF [Spirochaetes bacterium GWB1_36_13]|nr:MAG: imidazole glycerol phosphate synthase subunit HisF [Spirochaetes bacterium GWB1_36_13]
MLSKRIIPCLDIDNGRVVKGVKFLNLVDAGDPVENAKFYDEEGADELILLDITASSDNRSILFDTVKKVADSIHTPFTVGGGIRTIEEIKKLIQAGADKVSLNTVLVKNPEIISEGARKFGSQAMVAAIDAKRVGEHKWNIFIKGGREDTGLDALLWASKLESLGAGEILLTSMDKDGTKKGYDLELVRTISETVKIPVIASGGVGTLEDLYRGITEGKADAVLAASIFHFREYSIRQVKEFLKEKGVSIRL